MELSKKEKRELRREEKLQEGLNAFNAKKNKKIALWCFLAALIIVGGFASYRYLSKSLDTPAIGETYAIEGRNHVADGTRVSYNTNPPSSGAHYANPADWGVHDKPIADETLVHNLEHGGVWISYKPNIPEQAKNALKTLVGGYKSKVILTPRDANDSPIALVSWGRIYKINPAIDGSFDEKIIHDFIKKYKNTGPEFIPD